MTDVRFAHLLREEDRPSFHAMGEKWVFHELIEDARLNHATALFRFSAAIAYLAKKGRKSTDDVFRQLDAEVRSFRPQGLPVQPPPQLEEMIFGKRRG